MTQYAPAYTSMECVQDQEFNDEPYAIFWGVDWQRSPKISSFVRKTRVYHKIDDRETGGAFKAYDDKVLTNSRDWTRLDLKKHFILVQAMEHDNGSPTNIVKALRSVLKFYITDFILTKPEKSEDEIVEYAKGLMKYNIDLLNDKNGKELRTLLKKEFNISDFTESSLALIGGMFDQDDRVGDPQVLPLRGDKQELKFTSEKYGTYIYKFNIQSR